MKEITDVSAALIWDKSGRFLICRRPIKKVRGGLWEFVGGKVEAGETYQQALIRECEEELAVSVDVGSLYMEVIHAYPDLTVRLRLYNAKILTGEPQLIEHSEMRWIAPEEIPLYDFCPADEKIIHRLMQENFHGEELRK